jgi:anaphase-promoting complex subunit 3
VFNFLVSRATNESSFYTETPFVQHRPSSRTQSQPPAPSAISTSHLQAPTTTTATSRPLSSADESGPVAKRLRSQIDAGATNTAGTATVGVNLKTRGGRGASAGEVNVNGNGNNNQTLVKKPRARQALAYANTVPAAGRVSGSSSSRSSGASNSGAGNNSGGGGKSNVNPQAIPVVMRRSSRLLSGTGAGGGAKAGLKVCLFG